MGSCHSTQDEFVSHRYNFTVHPNGKEKQKIRTHSPLEINALASSSIVNQVFQAGRPSTFDLLNERAIKIIRSKTLEGYSSGVAGLKNLGNTCFMNSSLQCLSNTIPLTDYFLGFDFKSEINRTNFLGTKGELVTSYATLLKKLWLENNRSVDPKFFKSKLEHFAERFKGSEQHDSQEFLGVLLDGIHEDLNSVRNPPYVEEKDCDGTNDDLDSILAWKNYLKRNKSIIVDLFQGQLRNTLTCRNENHKNPDQSSGCGHKSVKFEPFMYLSLPLSEETGNINDCLKLFCREEFLTGPNMWYCTKCKKRVVATKKFDLWMLPPVLIVHLKRFKFAEFGSRSKINTVIKYPLANWDLSNFIRGKRKEDNLYDLFAISNHYGNLGSGHYTAQALNRIDNEWYTFDDSKTRRLDKEKIERGSKSAYCLFYNRSYDSRNDSEEIKQSPLTIYRQTLTRPDHWPHIQVGMTYDKDHENFRSFRRGKSTEFIPQQENIQEEKKIDEEHHHECEQGFSQEKQ